jgi:hypothetical protein
MHAWMDGRLRYAATVLLAAYEIAAVYGSTSLFSKLTQTCTGRGSRAECICVEIVVIDLVHACQRPVMGKN